MAKNETCGVITLDLTTNPNDRGEISIVATQLQAASFGAMTRREAIERARALVLARTTHANDCTVRAIRLAIAAPTDAEAGRLVDSALRFMATALKLAS